MKKSFNKITSMLLALCLVLGSVAFGAGEAFATGENWSLDVMTSLWAGDNTWVWVYDANSEDYTKATVTGVTSSNPAILAVSAGKAYDEYDREYTEFMLTGKTPGSAAITVNYTTPNGETGTLSATIQVKKYPKQIKSLKVNGKKVKISKHKYNYSKKVKKSKTTLTIKMALKKGWKISSVNAGRWTKSGKFSDVKVKKKALLKGKTIKFPKKYSDMFINVEMKKGSSYINYEFYFWR